MRINDAMGALKGKKKKKRTVKPLTTIWTDKPSEQEWRTHPTPQFRRKEWISLDGSWEYAITKDNHRPADMDGWIFVPFSPETARSGVQRRLEPGEYLWYMRYVKLEKLPKHKRLILHFGAVDQKCTVWWNGNVVGRHENGYLSFSFDVTDYLREGSNDIWLRVQDESDQGYHCRGKQKLEPGGMFYSAQSGIWQSVWMEWVPENYIEELKLTPLFDAGKIRCEIALTENTDIRIGIMDGADTYWRCFFERDFAKENGVVSVELSVPDMRPWTPEHPYLYPLVIQTDDDIVYSYFAMRKLSIGLDEHRIPRLFLNNKPYFFNGVLDQGYWPESLMTPPAEDAIIFDITQMKRLGFNMIRKHVKIEDMRWYYHCDRLGMVVWQDMVNGGGEMNMPFLSYMPTAVPAYRQMQSDKAYKMFARGSGKDRIHWEEDCMDMIRQLYNCPCIGLWVLFNEGWGQFDSLRITARVRKLDPTRLVDHASGWFDQGGGDVKSVHNYFRPLKVEIDGRKRPYVISEYGGYSFGPPNHMYCEHSYGYKTCRSAEDYTVHFKALMDTVRRLEKEGLCAAVYTQLSDIEEETNGLYSYDRKVCKII